MYLFVFLGNPGIEYAKTRHNAGFLVGDKMREKWGFLEWKEEKRFFGMVSEGAPTRPEGEKMIFLKPQTFMNLSGKAVQAVCGFYKIPPEKVFLVYDDKDLPFGALRYRESGSSGGHNGVKDILRVVGTEKISRIKIGVATPLQEHFLSTADFVLSRFTDKELHSLLEEIFPKIEEKILDVISEKSSSEELQTQ